MKLNQTLHYSEADLRAAAVGTKLFVAPDGLAPVEVVVRAKTHNTVELERTSHEPDEAAGYIINLEPEPVRVATGIGEFVLPFAGTIMDADADAGAPRGVVRLEDVSVYLDAANRRLIVCGDPLELGTVDGEGEHNCDENRCSSAYHILLRASVHTPEPLGAFRALPPTEAA